MSNIATVAANLNINANLTFDDLVNVAVSKFEDQLIERRTELQKRVKATEVERKSIITSIQDRALQDLEYVFPSRAEWAVSNAVFKFKIALNTHNEDYLKSKEVVGTITQTIMVDQENNGLVALRQYSSGGDDREAYSTTFYAAAKVGQENLNYLQQNDDILNDLRQQLLAINGELQGMDRKTRQVKALLAQQKMDELGITELMASPEINQLLRLPNNT